MQRAVAKKFEDLVVWQKAHRFVLSAYRCTEQFPKTEVYGLTTQLRKAAVSIPANIAEGFRRRGLGDKLRFLNIAQGSLEECRYYLILARDLGYAEASFLMEELEEVSKILQSCCASVSRSRLAS